jgi:hypothetical protein
MENDPSLAVHSVYGWYFPLLHYFDREWAERLIPRIFPVCRDLQDYWMAAWDAYVSFNRVYKAPFSILAPQYDQAIHLMGLVEDPVRIGTSRSQRLAEHLAVAYIHGLIDLDSEDILIEEFYRQADDALRAHIAFWLVRGFTEIELAGEDPIWRRKWRLMKWRVKRAAESGDVDEFREEVSAYMRWLEHAPIGFEEMHPIVCKAIPFLRDGYHKKLVIDYLAIHCLEHPFETVSVLLQIIKLPHEGWFRLYEDNAGRIMQAAMNSSDHTARQIAIDAINVLGELGDFRWKELLPDD